jgi:hypothetical protein
VGAKVSCKTPSYSSVLLGQNVVKNPSKKEWKIDNEQEEEIRRHSFFLHCTHLPPILCVVDIVFLSTGLYKSMSTSAHLFIIT